MTEPLLPQSETPMTPLDTMTRGFNPHAVPTTETLSEPNPPSPQLMAPVTPPPIPPDQARPYHITKPDNWAQMSKKQKQNWYQHKLLIRKSEKEEG